MSLVIENLPAAIRTTKQQLRAAFPEFKEIFGEVEAEMRQHVEEIVTEREAGHGALAQGGSGLIGNGAGHWRGSLQHP